MNWQPKSRGGHEVNSIAQDGGFLNGRILIRGEWMSCKWFACGHYSIENHEYDLLPDLLEACQKFISLKNQADAEEAEELAKAAIEKACGENH